MIPANTTRELILGDSRVRAIARNVETRSRFLRVDEISPFFDELGRTHPELVQTERIGTSRLGEPLLMTRIGTGSRSAMVVAGVHPNEAVGFLTVRELGTLLVTDEKIRTELGYAWYFVQNMDPDGTRLNESWFALPGDREAYAEHFFRPAPEEQPEWTFPTAYKRAYFDQMLPEAQAVARAIDRIRPSLYVSLHNSETGGAYWYVTETLRDAIDVLYDIASDAQVPVDRGEAESAHLTRLADGLYLSSRFSDDYDAAESRGDAPWEGFSGTSSTEYAAGVGAATLIPEVPYWCPSDEDRSDTSERYSDMLTRTANDMAEVATALTTILSDADPFLSIPSPFIAAARAFIPMMRDDATADLIRSDRESRLGARRATTPETVSRETRVRGFALRYGGMLRRALSVECIAGLAGPQIRAAATAAEEFYAAWLLRGDPVGMVAIPLERLVSVQLGSILAIADRQASDDKHRLRGPGNGR